MQAGLGAALRCLRCTAVPAQPGPAPGCRPLLPFAQPCTLWLSLHFAALPVPHGMVCGPALPMFVVPSLHGGAQFVCCSTCV